MKNRLFMTVMLVISLVFGMTVVGCFFSDLISQLDEEEESPPAMLRVRNESTFNIRYITFKEISGSIIRSDSASIGPGLSKTYEFSYEERNISVSMLVDVNGEDVEFNRSSIRAISDNSYISVVILRGATKETLELTSTGERK